MDKHDCIFCKISKGAMTADVIFENSEFKVILDAFPSGKGHTLIMPKEHIENIYEIDSDTAGKLFALATQVARALKKVLGCDGINILQNNEAAAGQTVNHFHMHIIPRYTDDELSFKWKTQTYTDEEKKEIARLIGTQI